MRSGPLLVAASPRLALPGGEGPAAATLVGNTFVMYENPRFNWISAWARLRPGVSREQVEATLRPQFDQFFAANVQNQDSLRNAPRLEAAVGTAGLDGMRRNYGETLLVLFAMVVVILTVACASIASLLLERATARRREMAVRMSLGAGRLTVIRQLLTESLLLALIGGIAGVVLSIAGTRALRAAPDRWERRVTPCAAELVGLGAHARGDALDRRGVRPCASRSCNEGRVFPALKGSRSALDAEAPKGRHRIAFGQVLVVAQIALSLVLLIGASLFAVTLTNLRTTELGFNQEGLLLANVDATRAGFDGNAVKSFYAALRERLRQVPGVDSASLSWSVLAGGGPYVRSVTVSRARARKPRISTCKVVGALVLRNDADRASWRAARSATSKSTRARPLPWSTGASRRRSFRVAMPSAERSTCRMKVQLRIVGVSANARHDMVRGDARPVVYYTYTWDPHPLFSMVLEVRTQGDPLAYANTLRTVVRDLNPEVRLNEIRTQAANTDRTISREILFARLSNAFALLALVIACAGLYGTVSYAMARQTPETGIRMALGATRSLVLRRALRQVLGLGVAGLGVGLPAALVASRYIESFLWGVAPHDPVILAGAALAVLVAVAAAGYAPASRASKVDPMAALRSD